jgi:hypothetical protein
MNEEPENTPNTCNITTMSDKSLKRLKIEHVLNLRALIEATKFLDSLL